MKDIAIYVEGGGDTAQQKAELRIGLDALLRPQKDAARAKRLGWRLAPTGGRQAAYEAFRAALRRRGDDTLVVLLVDSETAIDPETKDEAVDAKMRVEHLSQHDGWSFENADPRQVHLMVQCMEAWIVSDADALEAHYGKDFHASKLPVRPNLEEEPKGDVYTKLKNATRDTKKGEYAKIKHASKLLALIDPAKVGHRCPRFVTFINWLTDVIGSA
ncbi:MAG TPA: DUF4276 family protein [Pirellulales bacterium]|nr:DUF4276 family protein [Pirellulales bacterium]